MNLEKIVVGFFLAGVLFGGCASGIPTRAQRLEKFEQVLPPAIRSEFAAGHYDRTVQLMDNEYRINKTFQSQLDKVKDEECINIFTIKEVVEFYRDNFVNYEKNK